jgi:WD40 repeat protein
MWDIENKKEVTRVYFDNKIRGIDWSSDGQLIVVADCRAKLFLFNNNLSKLQD